MDDHNLDLMVKASVESGKLSGEQLKELHELLQARKQYRLFNKSEFFKPYQYQNEFYELGASKRWRLLCAGNRIGKTFSQAYEMSLHLTGKYPDDWKGIRFTKPIVSWFLGVTVDQCRDVGQLELLGTRDAKEIDEFGKGSIPRKYIKLDTLMKDGALVKSIKVKHYTNGVYDGDSLVTFKISSADNSSRMGSQIDYIWCDELPPFNGLDTFGQLVTRTIIDPDGKASVVLTGTPELGTAQLVQHFKDKIEEGDNTIGWLQAGWKDAHVSVGGHLTDQMIKDMMSAIPAYQLQMRMNGEPILGDGLIFSYPIRSPNITIQPIEIPPHWKRICALDIGISHPTAITWCAYDPDNDIIYVTDIYQMSDGTPDQHTLVLNKRGRNIPVVLPHDASQRQKDTGKNMIHAYREAGANVLSELFYNAGKTYKGNKTNDVDTGIVEIQQRLESGQLKIFANCQELIRGLESYSFKNGVIDKSSKWDDLIDSFRYAVMSVARRGKSTSDLQSTYNTPILNTWIAV
ncbi:terminase family protein [Escherichia coli]